MASASFALVVACLCHIEAFQQVADATGLDGSVCKKVSFLQVSRRKLNVLNPSADSVLDSHTQPLNMNRLAEDSHFREAKNKRGCSKIKILHIGKMGGSSINRSMAPCLDDSKSEWVASHRETFRALLSPEASGRQLVVFLRSPVKRYVSGWISRFRKGEPIYHYDWTPSEATSFGYFTSPNDLASALSSANTVTKEQAEYAMRQIKHVRESLNEYFGGLQHARLIVDRTVFLGTIEHFSEDWAHLVDFLESRNATRCQIQREPPREHLTPAQYDDLNHLNETALKNLRNWYSKDYEILDMYVEAGLLPKNVRDEIDVSDSTPW
mmetsp:Transcript_94385/g.148512  ORF Transcript_94385/g.148512 Transcript_94385/m.148512 type:complete len:324 (-) Transcript_94385:89-1060(-)